MRKIIAYSCRVKIKWEGGIATGNGQTQKEVPLICPHSRSHRPFSDIIVGPTLKFELDSTKVKQHAKYLNLGHST